MKSEIKKHLFELLTKEEIDVGWWDKYLELLFEFRKERVEALAEKAGSDEFSSRLRSCIK